MRIKIKTKIVFKDFQIKFDTSAKSYFKLFNKGN